MAVTYKNPGDALDAASWNALFSAVDAKQTALFGGLSPLLIGAPFSNSYGLQKLFFFFNPITLPAGLHPLAYTVMADLLDSGANVNGYTRQYTDAISTLLSSQPIDGPNVSVATATLVSGGLGYSAPGTLFVAGGTKTSAAAINIISTNGVGAITNYSLQSGGSYVSAPPLSANPVTGNIGTGATFNLSMSGVPPQSDVLQIVRVQQPNLSVWRPLIYPENTGQYTKPSILNLDASLSVIRLTINGKKYAVCLSASPGFNYGPGGQQPGNVNGFAEFIEQTHPWDEIDLIVSGNLNFLDTWDKYNVFRIHNFGLSAATVTFGTGAGGGSVTIPAGSCRSIRRTGGTYTAGYNYFQKMLPGDPRFFALANATAFVSASDAGTNHVSSGDIFNPTGVLAMISYFSAATNDPTQYQDISASYCPGYFPLPSDTNRPIGDFMVSQGEFLVVRWGTSNGHNGGQLQGANVCTPCQFVSFASLSVAMATANPPSGSPANPAGVSFSQDESTGVITFNFQTPAGFEWFIDIVDVSSNLASFIGGAGQRLCMDGSTPQGSGIPLGTWKVYHALPQWERKWRYIKSVQGTQPLRNLSVVDPTDTNNRKLFTLMDTVQSLLDFISQCDCEMYTVQNIQLKLTLFGPVITWQEVWPITVNFDPATIMYLFSNSTALDTFISSSFDTSQSPNILKINRCMILSQAFGGYSQWPQYYRPYAPALFNQPAWNFPRSNRRYSSLRAVVHNGVNEPWQSNTGQYTSYEPPNVARFFETVPASTEYVEPTTASIQLMNPFSWLGQMGLSGLQTSFGDPTGILLWQFLSTGGTNFATYLAAWGDAARGTGSFANVSLLTPCEAEHYNLVASEFNALLPGPSVSSQDVYLDDLGTTLYFRTGGAPTPFGSFAARNCFFDWLGPASGDPIADSFNSWGVPIQTSTPPGCTSTTYKWISIAAARELYARLSLPFAFSVITVPYTYIDSTTGYVQDPGGQWVSVGNNSVIPNNFNFQTPTSNNTGPGLTPNTVLLWMLEGFQDYALIAMPRNYRYSGNGGGYDNSVENNNPSCWLVSGAGGPNQGDYEHVIVAGVGTQYLSYNAANFLLFAFPVTN